MKNNETNIHHMVEWIAIVIVYFIWHQAFYNLVVYHELIPVPPLEYDELWREVGVNFFITAAMFVLNFLIVFLIYRNSKRIKLKIILDSVLSWLAWALLMLLINSLTKNRFDWASSAMENVLIWLIVEVEYLFRHYSDSRLAIQQAKHQVLQYQYFALKAQVNPHFLFNSLNVLNSLVGVAPEKAQQFIASLSKMYYYVMANEGHERVRLADELTFVDFYLSVLTMRFQDKLVVSFSGRQSVGNQEIVPFTLQMLIENVIKHNVISSKNPMTVTIAITAEGIEVSNPVHRRHVENTTHVGLRYLTELYAAQNREFRVENDGAVFTVTIPYLS